MVETIGVAIATFGETKWDDLARRRAIPSVLSQTQPCPYIHVHGKSLHDARNDAVRSLSADWVICLDADDELDPSYVEAMATAAADHKGLWLYQPATLGVYPDGHEDSEPVLIPKRDLLLGNYMVISTMFRRDLFVQLGGFQDLPAWEDWDLWIRMSRAGAISVPVPKAILRVFVTPDSRNSIPDAEATALHKRIRRQYVYVER